MDRLFPPLERIDPTQIVEVVDDKPADAMLRVVVEGLTLDGKEVSKTVRLPPPEIGEHSLDILAAFGFTPVEIDGYVAEGVIGVRDGG